MDSRSSEPLVQAPSGLAQTIEASTSAVSWAAVIAGAVVAVAASLILVALGSGFGLASVSPWANSGASATTFTVMTAIWLIVVQWIASGTGGYLTGRLRTKWVGTHTHEVFFRDTANGFLMWALATVIGAIALTSVVTSMVGGGVHAAATVASGAAPAAATSMQSSDSSGVADDVDTLFRSDQRDTGSTADTRAETARILTRGIANGDVPATDRTYLASLVVARTGISQAEAEKRIDAAVSQVKADAVKVRQAADTARKAASAFSIFTALSMLVGAFIACTAAALGGRQRDEHP